MLNRKKYLHKLDANALTSPYYFSYKINFLDKSRKILFPKHHQFWEDIKELDLNEVKIYA